ncbi:MAG: uracil-DNA glycosylase family protein [Pyrinomonadaceae bacterium]
MSQDAIRLLNEIRTCKVCAASLPYTPKPILNFSAESRIALIGQAPGLKVQKSGIPWEDASGDRLRDWLGVSKNQFYDAKNFAITPMGFCYPGKAKSGDKPPRPECAPLWMDKIFKLLPKLKLKILVGNYSQAHFLGKLRKKNLTETVRCYADYLPEVIVLPHPSPRNNIWLSQNPWFESELLPKISRIVKLALK